GILILYKEVYEIYPTKDYTNGGGEVPPIIDPSEVKVPYSIDFTKGQEPFTINDVLLPEGLSFIWANSSSYGMKASGYYQKAYATESWLISPVFDMTSTTAPVLKFSHTGRYFTNMEEEATLWAKVEGGEWEQLSIPTWFTNNDWNFVDAQVDLSKYVGKKITLGFKYTSKEAGAATWEIKTLSIDEVKEPELVIQGEQEFETSTTVTIVPSNPDNEVYYTIDGSDPVSSSTAIQYTKPFTLTETTTVKAFEEGAELYAEMTFTKKEVQLEEKTIADINEMTEDTKNVKLVLNNALVTYVDGTNIYLRENGKALMFFKTALPFTVGDVLKGSVIMDYDNYYGIHEMKDNDATSTEGITVVGKETPVPTEVSIPDVIALNHICDYIVLKSVKVVKDGDNYFAVDNAENKVQLYKGLDVSSFADDGKLYDVEGVFNNIYKGAPEVQPIDVTEAVSEGIANIVTNNANAKVYNLAGQRVADSYKGVVIVNGKKFIVK
ncbi:MAG: chitobiase/beta-hexosaminidase C-terminal domain-containing protein, partial [Prevotella sp.]|nr:chitobiase/beta-hexosaminidase C-terminal domain-containing protein [Prevotella sp.]